MKFQVYIIYSKALDRYYVGHTQDLSDRLYRHNNSGSKATKAVKNWVLVYSEEFHTRSEAAKKEKHIKAQKSRKFIEELIKS